MSTVTVESLLEDVERPKKALFGRHAETKDRMRATEKEIGAATNGCFPPTDLTANTHRLLDQDLDRRQREFDRRLPMLLSKGRLTEDEANDLFWLLLRETLHAGVPETVARLGDYRCGPPVADRAALIARLAPELEQLRVEEEMLVDDMLALGLKVEHRQDVKDRRANEQRKRELEAREVANRQAREAAIDERHAKALAAEGRLSS